MVLPDPREGLEIHQVVHKITAPKPTAEQSRSASTTVVYPGPKADHWRSHHTSFNPSAVLVVCKMSGGHCLTLDCLNRVCYAARPIEFSRRAPVCLSSCYPIFPTTPSARKSTNGSISSISVCFSGAQVRPMLCTLPLVPCVIKYYCHAFHHRLYRQQLLRQPSAAASEWLSRVSIRFTATPTGVEASSGHLCLVPPVFSATEHSCLYTATAIHTLCHCQIHRTLV